VRTSATFEGFVHRAGRELHDGLGRPITLRGVGLGNWLLPEGYMWRFPRQAAQSPREIEALIDDLVGPDEAAIFWRGFRERFITEDDIALIAAQGFDHVRLPLLARLLIDGDGCLLESGFALIDRLIDWCREHRLWVVLDLHGAPGGQTGTNIDDSPRGLPDLFIVGDRYRERTIALWKAIALRYRNEPVVAAYDLLNEPLPHEFGDRYADVLREVYGELTAAVRAVDREHLITYEGTHWSTNWSIFDELPDENAMLQFHKYWSAPDLASIAPYLEARERLKVPIYMGEGGENTPPWLQAAFRLYDDNDISWNFWPWKKLETWSSPLSVTAPEGWAAVTAYAAGSGERPSMADAQRILAELLVNVAATRCSQRTEVVHALFRRVPLTLAAEAFSPMPAPSFDYVDGETALEATTEVVLDARQVADCRVAVEAAGILRISGKISGSAAERSLLVDGSPAMLRAEADAVVATAPVRPPSAVISWRVGEEPLVIGPLYLELEPHEPPC
jgi:hypothetical protein